MTITTFANTVDIAQITARELPELKKEVKIGEKRAQKGRRPRAVMIGEKLAQVILRDRSGIGETGTDCTS